MHNLRSKDGNPGANTTPNKAYQRRINWINRLDGGTDNAYFYIGVPLGKSDFYRIFRYISAALHNLRSKNGNLRANTTPNKAYQRRINWIKRLDGGTDNAHFYIGVPLGKSDFSLHLSGFA